MRFTSAPSTMQFWQINTSGGFGAAPTLEDYIADGTVTVLGNNAVAEEADMVQGEWYTVTFDLSKMAELGNGYNYIGLQLGVLADLELKNVAFKKI